MFRAIPTIVLLCACGLTPILAGCEDDHDHHDRYHDHRVIIEEHHEGPAGYRVEPDHEWEHGHHYD